MYTVTDPATGVLIEQVANSTDEEVRDAIGRVHAGYPGWRGRTVEARAAIVARAADLFEERADELAAIMTQEMGKRINEGRGEIGIVVDIFRYYAEHGPALLADEPLDIKGGRAVTTKGPIGALLGIMPWNFPCYQVARFVAPNLMLGNTILLKHASICPRSGRAIEEILRTAGVPDDVYVNTYASSRQILRNCGQSCNAPKRMIVLADIYDEYVDRLTKRVAEYYLPGDPSDPETKLPPLASAAAADEVAGQVAKAVEQGATLRTGGRRITPGAFLEATVLTGVTPGMDAYSEEIFGPVVIVFTAETEDEAVALANDTPFGLGASVWGTDLERARRVAERIEAGMVYLNRAGGSQADLPFGGIKRSGIGRELGPAGIEEFMNKKSIRL